MVVNEVANGAQVGGVFRQCSDDGGCECGRAMGRQQIEQAAGQDPEILSTLSGA